MVRRNVFFLIFLVIVVGAAAFFFTRQGAIRQPPPSSVVTPTPKTLPSFTYKDLRPGTATEEQAIVSLGQPIRKEPETTGTTLVYSSGVGVRPLLVHVDPAGVVTFIKEPLEENSSFSQLSKNLGARDFVLYGPFYPLGYELSVYVKSGIALLTNPKNNTVRERWYFPANTGPSVFQRVFAPEYQTSPPSLDQE